MKKSTKIAVALLSVSCLAASAFAFTACGGNNNNNTSDRDPQIDAVYQQYVAYAESNGDQVMSYEEWLNSIKGAQGAQGIQGIQGIQGEKGDKGDTGAAGADGEDGKSAYQIWLDAGNTGSEEDFLNWLKGEDAHVHTEYSDVFTYIAPVVGKPGLGFKYCLDCKELVAVELEALEGSLVIGENRVVDYCLFETGTLYNFNVKLGGEFKFEVEGTTNASVTIEYQDETGAFATEEFTDSTTISISGRSVAKVYISWADTENVDAEGYILNVSQVSEEGGELVFGENQVTDAGINPAGTSYTFNTKTEGTYKFEVSGKADASVVVEYIDAAGELTSTKLDDSVVVEIPARTTVTVNVLWNGTNDAEATFLLNIDFAATVGGELAFGENVVTDAGINTLGTNYIFNNKVDGNYKFEVVGKANASIMVSYVNEDGSLVSVEMSGSEVFAIPARTLVTVNVLWDEINDAEATFLLNIDFAATEGSALAIGDNEVTDLGENPAGTNYTFNTKIDNNYKFELVGKANASVVVEYVDAEGALVSVALTGSDVIAIPARTLVTVNVLWNGTNDAEATFLLNIDFAATVGGELAFGENVVTDLGANPAGTNYTFNNKVDGNYKFEVIGKANASIMVSYVNEDGSLISEEMSGSDVFAIPARTLVTVNVLWNEVNDAEATFILNIDYAATEAGALVFGENTITDEGTNPGGTSYTFSTKIEADYKFVLAGNSGASVVVEYIDATGALMSVILTGSNVIAIPARADVTVNVKGIDGAATCNLTIDYAATEGSALAIGDNEVTDLGENPAGTNYTFSTKIDNNYKFELVGKANASVVVEFIDAEGALVSVALTGSDVIAIPARTLVTVNVLWNEVNDAEATFTLNIDYAATEGSALAIGDNEVTDLGENPAGTNYTFSTKIDNNYKFELVGKANASVVVEFIDAEGALVSVNLSGSDVIAIPARTLVTVNVLWNEVNDAEATFTLNINYAATEAGALAIGNNEVTDLGANPAGTNYTYAVETEGSYTLTVSETPDATIVVEYTNAEGSLTSESLTDNLTISVAADSVITVNVLWNGTNDEETSFVLALATVA